MLFSCSVAENIAYGAPDPSLVTEEEIHQAARMANAYDFVQDFPLGFDTVVGEKGVLLSGGSCCHGYLWGRGLCRARSPVSLFQ